MKIDFSRLYGNERLKSALAQRISTGTAAHAYLLEGKSGSGKTTLAFLLAAAMCCEDDAVRPCGRCLSCRKIYSAQSPDLYTLGLDALPFADGMVPQEKTKSIGVDAVRALKNDVYIKPNDLDRKLYIFGHTERMTPQAQNALLKILEEPPETVVFFLLCENRAALLPTVLSRVQTLPMERFDDDALAALLIQHDSTARALAERDRTRFRLFVRLSDGAYGSAQRYLRAEPKALAEDGAYDAHEGAVQCLSALFSDGMTDDSPLLAKSGQPRSTRTGLQMVVAQRGDTRERLGALMDALCTALRDLILCAVGAEGTLMFYPELEQPMALSERCGTQALMQTFQTLAALRETIDANPNVGLLQTSAADALYALRN